MQVCQISNATLIAEVNFVPQYQKLLRQLRLSVSDASLASDAQPLRAEPSIKDLAMLASNIETKSTCTGDILKEFFLSAKLPSVSVGALTSQDSANNHQAMFNPVLLNSMVSFDIAIVSEIRSEESADMLRSARKGLADVVVVRSAQTGFGIGQFADQLVSLADSNHYQMSANEESLASLLCQITSLLRADKVKLVSLLYDRVTETVKRVGKGVPRGVRCSSEVGSFWEAAILDAMKCYETHLPRGGLLPVILE